MLWSARVWTEKTSMSNNNNGTDTMKALVQYNILYMFESPCDCHPLCIYEAQAWNWWPNVINTCCTSIREYSVLWCEREYTINISIPINPLRDVREFRSDPKNMHTSVVVWMRYEMISYYSAIQYNTERARCHNTSSPNMLTIQMHRRY